MAEFIGNRYRIVKLIGKGGMADVYLAFDTILKREVAVKVLKSDMADDVVALERFKREAGAVTQLSHPNIVDVYDVGDDGDKHYIVMEYVKGYTLKQLIKKRGPIPYKEAVWLMKQLAGALMEAHRNNVIHRDIKSQNVLIKDDGTVKLSDFGIAMASGAMQITHQGSVIGSVHYLAPELAQGKQATMQSDIYSLGIVFYELLTGDVPYKADTPVQVALQHIKGTIPSVRDFNPEIPQSVDNILIRATAKSPNQRYRNIALMLKDLNECLKKEHRDDKKVILGKSNVNNQSIHVSDLADENNPSRKSPVSVLFLVMVSIISVVAIGFVLLLSGVLGREKMVTVPDLRNMTVQEAKDILAEKNLEVDDSRITWTLSDDVEKDNIISSSPAENEEVEVGTKIKLTVSRGLYSTLNNYVGKDYKEAVKELRELKFKVTSIPVNQSGDPGKVIEQSMEAGSKYDSTINNEITIRYIPEAEVVLALKGMSFDEASEYLDSYGIKNYTFVELSKDEFTEEELMDAHHNRVIRSSPALGSVYSISSDDEIILYYYGRSED